MWDVRRFVITRVCRVKAGNATKSIWTFRFLSPATSSRVHCLDVITEFSDCGDDGGGSRAKTLIKDVYPRKVDFRHEPTLETLR